MRIHGEIMSDKTERVHYIIIIIYMHIPYIIVLIKNFLLIAHDTKHHVVPKSMQLQTVLFRPSQVSSVQYSIYTHLWYHGTRDYSEQGI